MKRLWCQRLKCGRIVGVAADGMVLLCTRKYGHAAHRCFHFGLFLNRSAFPVLDGEEVQQ